MLPLLLLSGQVCSVGHSAGVAGAGPDHHRCTCVAERGIVVKHVVLII